MSVNLSRSGEQNSQKQTQVDNVDFKKKKKKTHSVILHLFNQIMLQERLALNLNQSLAKQDLT